MMLCFTAAELEFLTEAVTVDTKVRLLKHDINSKMTFSKLTRTELNSLASGISAQQLDLLLNQHAECIAEYCEQGTYKQK